MKAEQSSLYRRLEQLHLWCLDTFDNAPKNIGVYVDIQLLISSIVQAQTSVQLALDTENLKQKLDLLDVVVMDVTNVKTITKVLTEYSGNIVRGKHFISKNDRIRLLDIMTQIGNELGRWRNKTMSVISLCENKQQNPD